MNKKTIDNSKDRQMVKPQNIKLADQGKAPGQKQNTSQDRKDNKRTTKKRGK